MNKRWAWIFPVILVVLAIGIAYFFDTGDGTPYTSSSTGELGASLLYDTLRHMGYGVRVSYRPLTTEISANDVFIIIQPRTPQVCHCMAEEMREWVRGGGRLIYLCNKDTHFTPYGHDIGDFRLNRLGKGEIISGRATPVTNRSLMDDYTAGEAIQTTLKRWNAEREIGNIFFAEYYHGFRTPETFVGRLPLVIRLLLAQMIILAIISVWYLGKRFGNPVPYYEEVEREENEYVRALAKLYMVSKKGDGKNA